MCRDGTGTDDPRTNPKSHEKYPNFTAITDLHRLTDTALPPIVLSGNHAPATTARKKSGLAGSRIGNTVPSCHQGAAKGNAAPCGQAPDRSEERRVGKEC